MDNGGLLLLAWLPPTLVSRHVDLAGHTTREAAAQCVDVDGVGETKESTQNNCTHTQKVPGIASPCKHQRNMQITEKTTRK